MVSDTIIRPEVIEIPTPFPDEVGVVRVLEPASCNRREIGRAHV